MAIRIRAPISSASRCISASRQYATSSNNASSSRGPRPQNSQSGNYGTPSTSSHPNFPTDPSIPEPKLDSSTAKIFTQTGPVILSRRPPVRPPPTIALPPSMSPPSPQPPLPKKKRAAAAMKQAAIGSDDKPIDGLWNIYQDSLIKRDTEPTLEDLNALRPQPSTIRAALNGVLGAGRTQLPENHQLHLTLQHLGAQEAPVGGGPGGKKKVFAGSGKAKKLEYTALYEATEGLLNHGFTATQLRQFARDLKVSGSSKADSKQQTIHRIMNSHFKMMHPLVLRKNILEATGKLEEKYPVIPSELFILLGRDGENLLQLAKQLHLSILVDQEPPTRVDDSSTTDHVQSAAPRFVLRVSGVKADHERLVKHLEELRNSVTVRTVTLPAGPMLSPPILQSISRISGAYCENAPSKSESFEESQPSVLISARDARSAYTAERLVQRAALEDSRRSRLPLLSLSKSTESSIKRKDVQEYALYPFDAQSFRLQCVKPAKRLSVDPNESPVYFQYERKSAHEHDADPDEEFIMNGPGDSEQKSVANGGKKTREVLVIEDDPDYHNVVAMTNRGETTDLYKWFEDTVEQTGGSTRKAIATFGHIAFKNSGTSTLLPPLQGPVSIETALKWTTEQPVGSRLFVPGLVPPFIRSMPGFTRSVHRLQYRSVDKEDVVDVNVELPLDDTTVAEPIMEDKPRDESGSVELTGEQTEAYTRADISVEVADGNNRQAQVVSESAKKQTESTESIVGSTERTTLASEILVGTEKAIEVMLPGSTIDVTLQVSNTSPIEPGQVPDTLVNYLDDLSTFFTTDADMYQPDPPQSLYLNDKHYILYKNISGRVGVESISSAAVGCTVITETTLDLENNARISFTQAFYDGSNGVDGWSAFVRLCLGLAAKPYQQTSKQAKASVP